MLGGMGGIGGMGGFGGGMGGFDAPMPQMPPFFTQFDETCERIAMGLVNARVRTRALLELLEEKGVFAPGQFDERASQVWERDYDTLAAEITAPLNRPPEESQAQPDLDKPDAPPLNLGDYYTEALMGFVDDAVAARVRMRSIIELLEEKGVFAPGEFDKKAEFIWERDYEELAMDFHKGSY